MLCFPFSETTLNIENWVNDALMAVFFLLIGLELERELRNGELSNVKNAMLPVLAAAGGIVVPALIHFSLNHGTGTQAGLGIPMATDIAFALGVLALLGNRVPASLKIFLTALAVMDDLGAIIVIALFYTADLSIAYLMASLAVFLGLVGINRFGRVTALSPYLFGGALMWFFMLKSGVHATIAGVLLAFAIPYSTRCDDKDSPSHRLEHILHKPVTFLILPIFALANTGVVISPGWGLTYCRLTALALPLDLPLVSQSESPWLPSLPLPWACAACHSTWHGVTFLAQDCSGVSVLPCRFLLPT